MIWSLEGVIIQLNWQQIDPALFASVLIDQSKVLQMYCKVS